MKDEMGGSCSTYGEIVVRKPEEKGPTGRRRCEGNIKINLKVTKSSHHTCKYKAVSYSSTPLPVSTHNNPLFIRSIWFAEQTLSLREYRLTGSHRQKTDIPAYYTTGF